MSGFEYLLSRTTGRPREVVQFVSKAHEMSVTARHSLISAEAITIVESEMSQWKLDHVCSEYKSIYPKLTGLLQGFRGQVPFLSRTDVERNILKSLNAWKNSVDTPIWLKKSTEDIIQILYSIDFLGVERPNSQVGSGDLADSFEFSYQRPNGNAHLAAEFLVHRAFWKALELHGG
jgi:hypothetical protein